MHDSEEEDHRPSRETPRTPPRTPPLRLAGTDEDDTFEPHVVRGID